MGTLANITARLKDARARSAAIGDEIASITRAAIEADKPVPPRVTKLSADREKIRLEIEALIAAEAAELEAERERAVERAREAAVENWTASKLAQARMVEAAADVERALSALIEAAERLDDAGNRARALAHEAGAGVTRNKRPVLDDCPFNFRQMVEARTGDVALLRVAKARATAPLDEVIRGYCENYRVRVEGRIAEVLTAPEAA